MSERLYLAPDGTRRPECSCCHGSIANGDDGLCAGCRIGLAVASRCPRCHGRGYLTEDPMPDCPAFFASYEQTECPKCEGTGEQTEGGGP